MYKMTNPAPKMRRSTPWPGASINLDYKPHEDSVPRNRMP